MKILVLASCFQALNAFRPRCKPDPVESRSSEAEVILSSTCERYESQTGICLQAKVWRIMKGSHHLEKVHGKSTTLTEYGEDITLPIYGFGDKAICKSKIRQGETKIIFAKTDREGTILTLASSPLSISHGNLEKVEALSKGELVEDKCARTSCSFGAVCDPTSGLCQCVDMRCEREEVAAVCGSDGVTYLNECELNAAQCRDQKFISMQYHGLCRDVQMSEIECRQDDECHNGSICNVGICRCPACDANIPADVCGNDGNTYRSECDLNRRKCKENIHSLAVEHEGICRVCNPIYWDGAPTKNSRYCEGDCLDCENEPTIFSSTVCATKGSFRRVFGSECLAKCTMGEDIDLQIGNCYEPPCEECKDKECKLFGTEWKCNCPLCPAEHHPVCGSDGVTYQSLCVLKRTNCEFGSGVEFVSSGKCPEREETEEMCKNECFFGAYCERGRCKCDFNCKNIDRPVCSDNHIEFKNECALRQFECEIQQPVHIAKDGHCPDDNDESNCPIYTAGVERTVDGVECRCPECEHQFGDSAVCGSDGILYDSRCELRSQACHFNQELYEVPLEHCGVEVEGSGGGEVCKFGGVDVSDRFDDDEEFSNQIYCRCNWHCPDFGVQVVAEGVVFDNLCKYYRDGNCKNQRELVITKSNCNCNHPGAYNPEGSCDHEEGCLCKPGYKGRHCDICELNYYQLNGLCVQCSCSQQGSRGALCDENGQCFCKAGFIGQKCDIKIDMQPDECQGCTLAEVESGAVCGDDHRIYGSLCGMRRLHCNKKPENQPEAVKYFKQCLFSGYPQIEIDSEDESSEESEIMEDIIMPPILPPAPEPTGKADEEGSGGYIDPHILTCDDEECENNSISLSEAKLPQDSSIDFDSMRYDVILTLAKKMGWNDKARIEKDLSEVFAAELKDIKLKSASIDAVEEKSATVHIEISPDKPYLESEINTYLQENLGRSSITQFNILHGQWFGGESFERYSFERCDTTYEFEIKFKFRTRDPNGVIFWAGNPFALDKTLALKIKDSKLELSFAENEPYRYKKAVNDNVWHTVELKFNRGGITLILDHVPRPEYIAAGKKDSRELDLSNIYIGGIPKDEELDILSRLGINKGLTGCFQMISGSAVKSGVYENAHYPVKSVYSYGTEKCDGRSPCQNNLNECEKDDSCVEWDGLRFCEASKGPHRSQGVKMNGSSILMFDSEEPKRISSIEIEFESTPGKASYGLLHIAKTVVLSVDERRLRLDLSLHGTDTAGMQILEDQFPLEDGVNTKVRLEFKPGKVEMKMCQDKCRSYHSQTKTYNRRKNRIEGRLVIGQIHPSTFSHLSGYFQQLVGFHGVFRSLKLNDEQLALWQDADLRRMVAPAYEPAIPFGRKVGPVKFNNAAKYFNFVTEPLMMMDEVSVQMKIKVPENTERETIYYSSNELGTSSLKIHVRSGYLVVRLEIEDIKDGNDVLLELESLYRIDRNEWTDIEVVYKKEKDVGFRTLNLLIDNGSYADSDLALTTVDFAADGFAYIGGMKNEFGDSIEGFRGCISDVYLNKRELDLRLNLIEAPPSGLGECK